MHITLIAGARPNFVKIAPIIHAIHLFNDSTHEVERIEYALVHTGQHYDKSMSDSFFEDLDIPEPNINLGVGSGSQAEQTAKILVEFEKYILGSPTDCVLVVGDVNSTLSCAIVAKKLNVKLAHVEGGLRSGDMTMPEEVNRRVTDSITDYFFTTHFRADENLKLEGVDDSAIIRVGNTMIDSLVRSLPKAKNKIKERRELQEGTYYLLTLHRPSNVDDVSELVGLLEGIDGMIQNDELAYFPIHPRTKAQLGEGVNFNHIKFLDPLPYLEFLGLMAGSNAVITDSGGIQEETTYLDVPCLTMRENTERPETVEWGSNLIVGKDLALLENSLQCIRDNNWKKSTVPELWDGKASERIIASLSNLLNENSTVD